MSRNPFVDKDDFLIGYLQCAVWSTNDPVGETPLDEKYEYEDIDPAWKRIAEEDCAVFCRNYTQLLVKFGELVKRNAADLGQDFWLTRNGHGTGFWDRYLEIPKGPDRDKAEVIGEELSEAARVYGECDLFVWDMLPLDDEERDAALGHP